MAGDRFGWCWKGVVLAAKRGSVRRRRDEEGAQRATADATILLVGVNGAMDESPGYYFGGSNRYFDAAAWNVIVRQAEQRSRGPQSNKLVAKRVVARRRELRKRQKAILANKAHARSEKWHRTIEKRGLLRWHILAAFEPGAWYALSDIATLSGVPVCSVKAKVNIHLVSEGLIAKVENPDWYDRRDERGFKVWLEPRYLYGLTERGITARAVARSELEARGWPSYGGAHKCQGAVTRGLDPDDCEI
jgi:hypothetical protein